MKVTKHTAELCTLLVRDVFGELPSRILSGLFTRGPSTSSQLGQFINLNPRHLRHGLAVLVQQSLVYHHTNPLNNQTTYEANPDSAYNLLRIGKFIDIVGSEYGPGEQEIIQTLAVLGHAKVGDLAQAYNAKTKARAERRAEEAAFSLDAEPSEPTLNGTPIAGGDDDKWTTRPAGETVIKTTWHLHELLAQMIQSELLDVLGPTSMRKLHDVYDEIEQNTQRRIKDAPAKVRHDSHLEMVKEFRAARAATKRLKRDLDNGIIASKRRKLNDGSGDSGEYEFEGRTLASDIVIRINYERLLVDLRNERLARYAADVIGETTGQVFGTVLRLLTKGMPRCRSDPRVDAAAVIDDGFSGPPKQVTTLEILDQLSPSVNVHLGIGKTDKTKIDKEAAEKIRLSAIDTEDEADSDAENPTAFNRPKPQQPIIMDIDSDDEPAEKTNGDVNGEAKEESSGDGRTTMLRQHLLLLAEHKYRFVRHCGHQGRGQWTIDFDMLMSTLRQVELDAIISQSFGRHGLRLTRILQQKGRLDEKTLASLALMKKQAVQNKILELQQGGFVEIQEVPRDNNRMANRTMFFWFCDPETTKKAVAENLQKMTLRTLERLVHERLLEHDLLEYMNRSDVRGNEHESTEENVIMRYTKFLDIQDNLLGEAMRLDDMTALFTEY